MRHALRILLAFIVLDATVITHELGHFFAARVIGVEADTISLGFGSKLIGWQIEPGLEVRVSSIPLGGYVSFSERGEKELAQKPVYQQIVVYGAGIAVNWFLPIFVLLICSPQYRKLDKNRNRYPVTLLRADLLTTRQFKLPFIGPFFFFRALVTPVESDGTIVEEYAWKFSDLSRLIGYFNILPVLSFDGYYVLTAIINAFVVRPSLQSIIYFFLFIMIFQKWWHIQSENPHYYRALL